MRPNLLPASARRTLLPALLLAYSCTALSAADPKARDWTLEDSLAVRYFVSGPGQLPTFGPLWAVGVDEVVSTERESGAIWMADKSAFFFVTRRGELETDSNVYELSVYRVSDVEEALASGRADSPRPYRSFTRRSYSSKYGAIGLARWDPSGNSIHFVAEADDRTQQVFRYDLEEDRTSQLTRHPRDVENYSARGQGIVFFSREPAVARAPEYPLFPVEFRADGAVLALKPAKTFYTGYYAYGAAAPRAGAVSSQMLSPDGRYVVSEKSLPQPTPGWPAFGGPDRKSWSRFEVFDLQTGFSRPLIDAPTGEASREAALAILMHGATPNGPDRIAEVLWSADGSHVVMVNTHVPAGTKGGDPHMT